MIGIKAKLTSISISTLFLYRSRTLLVVSVTLDMLKQLPLATLFSVTNIGFLSRGWQPRQWIYAKGKDSSSHLWRRVSRTHALWAPGSQRLTLPGMKKKNLIIGTHVLRAKRAAIFLFKFRHNRKLGSFVLYLVSENTMHVLRFSNGTLTLT